MVRVVDERGKVVEARDAANGSTATWFDADGHPLDAVARLARELAAFDLRLEAGDWVITGGLTKACALEVGGRLVGVFSFRDPSWVEVSAWRR